MPRIETRALSLICAVLAILCHPAVAGENAPKPVSFIRDVAPILVRKCQACHGPKTAESNYRLDSFDALMHPGDFGSPPITGEDLDNSELYRLITAEDPEERMPNNGGQLADAEIQAIALWIREGARFDGQNPAAPLRTQIPPDIPHPAAPESYPTAFPVTAMAFTADGTQMLVGGYHELLVWDAATGSLAARVGNIPQRTFGMTFSPDKSWLAVAGGSPGVSGEVRLIPWRDGPRHDVAPRILAVHDDVFFDVAFRPDGEQLAAVGADGAIRLFDVATGRERLKISNHADWVTDVCFSHDGQRIATASRDKSAKVFDAASGRLLATYSEHDAPVTAVAFTPDGKSVFSAGGNRIHVWNIEDSKRVGELGGFNGEVTALLIDGETIVAASADRSARQFKLKDRALVRSLTGHPAPILSLAHHEPTQRLSAGCFDGTVTVWNLETGSQVKQFSASPQAAAKQN